MASGEFKNALRGTDEIEITATGRKSGREICIPCGSSRTLTNYTCFR